jgi:tRNA pseudouridine55 synthase
MTRPGDIFAVYKPKGVTSHDVVDVVRNVTGEKRVGHAGTLDPLARGVLVVGVGREATKRLSTIVKKEKEYIGTILLGVTSTTDDEEGQKNARMVTTPPTREEVESAVTTFAGKIEQIPPAYSAIKVHGERAYRKARRGKKVILGARRVEVKTIDVLSYAWPLLELRVITGPGVYIRALARDIGEKLGTGGYLSELERIRVGEFDTEHAFVLDSLQGAFDKKRRA